MCSRKALDVRALLGWRLSFLAAQLLLVSFFFFLQHEQRHTLACWAHSARILHSFFRAP
jgi:hypothetical protein